MKILKISEVIEGVEQNGVFVFGSNIYGFHGSGSARFAFSKGWATWGHGYGLDPTGKAYAINTMGEFGYAQYGKREEKNAYLKKQHHELLSYIKAHQEKQFYIAAHGIGGISKGFTDQEFFNKNIILILNTDVTI